MTPIEITPSHPTVELQSPLDPVDENPQRVFEVAETFRQDASKFLDELKLSCQQGKIDDAVQAALKLRDASRLVNAVPMLDLSSEALTMSQEGSLTELSKLITTMETAIQGTIDLLRKENLLKESDRLPEPIETGLPE